MADHDSYQHGTVDDDPVVSVTLPTGTRRVRVINRSGAAEIAVSTNGATPSLSGNNPIIPASIGASAALDMSSAAGGVLKLLSTATSTTYSVWVVS